MHDIQLAALQTMLFLLTSRVCRKLLSGYDLAKLTSRLLFEVP